MLRIAGWISVLALAAGPACGAEGVTISRIYDQQLTGLERNLVSLAEAMPPDRFGFAPNQGEFSGVRTFGQQAAHTAAVIFLCAASVLEEKAPVDTGGESGPAALKTREDVLKYLKDAFAYGHKAMASLTEANLAAQVPSPFGKGAVSRASMASAMLWHSYDHYGQMVVYLRMNGVVPPSSRR